MSTITKEQAQKIIEAADEVITALAGTNEDVHPEDSRKMCDLWDDLNDRYAPPEVVRELARIALASLEAEPVGYMNRFTGRVFTLEEQPGADTDAQVYVPLYTAPPAPVSVPDERAELQGADGTLISEGTMPATQIKPVADLYGISVPGGRTTTYSTDAAEASDCRVMGWSVQECVKLERYQAAMLQGAEPVTTAYKLPAIGWLRADYQDDNRGLRGNAPLFVLGKKDPSSVWGLDYIPLTSNSPVIPDGWRLVPEEPTHEMLEAGDEQFGTYDVYRRMIAASPQQK